MVIAVVLGICCCISIAVPAVYIAFKYKDRSADIVDVDSINGMTTPIPDVVADLKSMETDNYIFYYPASYTSGEGINGGVYFRNEHNLISISSVKWEAVHYAVYPISQTTSVKKGSAFFNDSTCQEYLHSYIRQLNKEFAGLSGFEHMDVDTAESVYTSQDGINICSYRIPYAVDSEKKIFITQFIHRPGDLTIYELYVSYNLDTDEKEIETIHEAIEKFTLK